MTSLREHRLALGLVLLICALAAFGKLHYLGTTPSGDYAEYIDSAKLLSGISAPVHPARLLKPLAPLGVALAAPLTGFPTAFIFEVVLGYFIFAIMLYALGYAFFGMRREALFVALLGTLSYPMLRYGLDLYTETGAMAFYCLALLLTLWYLKNSSRKLVILSALSVGIGFLWKEYSVVTGLIFFLILCFEAVETREKIRRLVLFSTIALVPTLAVQLWVYLGYHYTYLDWYFTGGANGYGRVTLFDISKSLFAILGFAWLWVPIGLMRVRELTPVQKRLLSFALVPPFIALLWGFVSSRLFLPIAPAFLLLAVLGVKVLPKWWRAAMVAAIVFADLAWLLFTA